ncbi:MAG: 4-amino-4-deoxy-L-arabinose transferase-like glycosyltransferase [Arenicella sp.]
MLLSAIIVVILFLKLDCFHMRWWDESMYAVNAYEMVQSGEYFSYTFDGEADLFNSKPPLTIWLQILSIKIVGYNELAMRLPSAIAAAITVLILFRFLSKNFSSFIAWTGSLILLSTVGFTGYHAARTGDSDALLTLFLTASAISFFNYILKEKTKDIFIFLIFLTLAFATKSFASLLFLPAIFIILIRLKFLKKFVLNWHFAIGFILLIGTVISLLWLRESQTPGYISTIFTNDAGRLFRSTEGGSTDYFYYIDLFFTKHFSWWIIPFILGSFFAFYSPKPQERRLLKAILLLIISYLFMITISGGKHFWYDIPLFPLMSIAAAFGISYFLENTLNGKKTVSLRAKSFLIIALVSYPLILSFRQTQSNYIPPGEMKLEANEVFMHESIRQNQSLDGITVLYHGWRGSLLFYKYKLSEEGQKISMTQNISELHIGDEVLVCHDSLNIELMNNFYTKNKIKLDMLHFMS